MSLIGRGRPHRADSRIMSMTVASPDAEDDLVADINTNPARGRGCSYC